MIKKGTKGEIGYFYFSRTVNGTIADARKVRDKALAEYKLNKTVSSDKGNTTLEEFCQIFLENHCVGYSPLTYDGAVSKINYYIVPEIGKYKLCKLDTLVLWKFVNKLLKYKKKDKPDEIISTTTANDVYRLLRNILNRAVDWGFIESNPLLKVPPPPIAQTEKETYNRVELEEVFANLKQETLELKCLFMISMFTGLRKGEVLGLHLEDIDYKNEVIYIRRDVVRDKTNHTVIEKLPKTKKSVRTVPLPSFCFEIIKEYLEWRERKVEGIRLSNPNYKEIPNLFISENGDLMRPEYPTVKWNKFVRKYKLKIVTLHGLRHSYCTLQLNENDQLGPNDVAKLLGDSQLSTTFHYSHANNDRITEAISIFDDFGNGRKFNINQIISICTGRKYTSTNELNEIINYLLPDSNELMSDKLRICKNKIIKNYPKLIELDDNGVNINNIFDWLDEQKEKYGESFFLNPIEELEFEFENLEMNDDMTTEEFYENIL